MPERIIGGFVIAGVNGSKYTPLQKADCAFVSEIAAVWKSRPGTNEVTENALTRRYISFNKTKCPSSALTSSEIAEKPSVRESFEGDKKRFLGCE